VEKSSSSPGKTGKSKLSWSERKFPGMSHNFALVMKGFLNAIQTFFSFNFSLPY